MHRITLCLWIGLATMSAAQSQGPEQARLAREHYHRGVSLMTAESWDEAAAELERLVELQPARAEVYGDLATIYLQAGRVEQAAGALDRGSQAGFLSGQHYYSLGARLYRDEDYEGARRALEQALQIDPDMARAERSLGAALQRLDRLDEAVVHLRRYLELAPDAPDADRVAEQIRAAKKR